MEYITVKNDMGKEEKLEIIEELDIQNKHYVIVSPVGSEQAYAYRTIDRNGFREYESVGEGKEFDMILKKFNEMDND